MTKEVDFSKYTKQMVKSYNTVMASKLDNIDWQDLVNGCNPQQMAAQGIRTPRQLVVTSLRKYIAISEATVFGNNVVDPLAKAAAALRKGVTCEYSDTRGTDIIVETPTDHKSIAIKSGPRVFNSAGAKQQGLEFTEQRRRFLSHRGVSKNFEGIVIYSYGRVKSRLNNNFRQVAGKEAWEELSGDPELYLKLIGWIEKAANNNEFKKRFNAAVRRILAEFPFITSDGRVDYVALTRYNSSDESNVC